MYIYISTFLVIYKKLYKWYIEIKLYDKCKKNSVKQFMKIVVEHSVLHKVYAIEKKGENKWKQTKVSHL